MVKYQKNSLDKTFSALSDPTRREILAQLAVGERCASELAAPFSISLPAISKHLKILEEAGLIARRREGRIHYFQLTGDSLREATQWLAHYQQFWAEHLDALADYLDSQ